jgi:hypothetical protein
MAHGSLASFYLNGIEMGAFEAVLAPNALGLVDEAFSALGLHIVSILSLDELGLSFLSFLLRAI